MSHAQDNTTQISTSQGPPLALGETLKGRNLIVLGGTGFVGKVWLSMLLRHYPDLGQLYLLVRAKKGLTSNQRFWQEIVTSPSFDPIRALYEHLPADEAAEAFRKFMGDKITPLDGDVTREFVGLEDDFIAAHKGKIDAVVNVSGVVDFNPPIDEAIKVNCFGVKHIVDLSRALGDVPVLHTSTCYVAGNRDGTILEEDPLQRPFPRCGEIDISHWDPEREILEGARLKERAHHEAHEAFRQSEFAEQAKANLKRKGESCRGEVLADELDSVRNKYIDNMLAREGQIRAEHWGWTNTYTYTKSIGEQLLLQSGVPATIVRPAIVESSSFYPMVGWNEGINTSAPLIYIILEKGTPHLPGSWECHLDIIPCDMVCAAMIGALGALLEGRHKPVYQLGSSDVNPISTGRIQEIISLYKRRSRRKHPKGNPLVNALQKAYGSTPVSAEYFRKYAEPAYARVSSRLSNLAKSASSVPGLGFLRGTSKTLAGVARQLENTANVYETFMPFMYDRRYRFDCSNTRALFASLDEKSREQVQWNPEEIEWRQWLTEVHVPGLEKWVMPLIDEKLRKKQKQLRRYRDLISMMEERVDDNYYGVCMQQLKGERLHRLTYGEFRLGVYGMAAQLQEVGLKQGDRVLLAGDNSPFWGIAYFGILRAGGVVVPLDPEIDAARLRNVQRSSHATHALWDLAFEADCGATLLADAPPNGNPPLRRLMLEETVQEIIDAEEPATPKDVTISPDDVASVIFTSGTTGEPKGVMLTHDNFTSILASLVPLFPLTHRDCSLSLLPLHHTFEFTCGLLLPFSRGARITYVEELTGESVVNAMQQAQVTALVGVPALWQLLARRIESRVREKGKFATTLFDMLLSANQSIGKGLGLDFGRLLFATVHQQMGGHLRYLISGGAALPKETQTLFAGLGLHLTEGYGLTEAAPVLTVSRPSVRAKAGSVGKPIPGVEIKIDDANEQGIGEVLARGDNVMSGYAGNPEATKTAITTDGWLRTGDLGKLDHKGRLSIVGRAKEVIVTASGENVYPDDLEEMIGSPDYVDEFVVVGITDAKGEEHVALLAVPTKTDANSNGVDFAARASNARTALKKRFKDIPRAMRPTVLHFRDALLPRTATRKVKRQEVREILELIEQDIAASSTDSAVEATPLATRVTAAISKVTGASARDVRKSPRLAADLGIDSLMMKELQLALEEVAGCELPSDEVANCESVGELVTLLGAYKGTAKSKTAKANAKKTPEKEEDGIVLPKAVQDVAKDLMRHVQLAFYDKVMDVKVAGRANIPHNRNTIVVANHASHLDLGLIKSALGSYAQDIVTLGAKDYFFEGDKLRQFYFENLTNVIPVERQSIDDDGLEGAREALREGKTLLLFPEGTRGETGVVSTFRSGMGVLAQEFAIDILPVYVEGSFESMPKGRALPTRRELRARIGEVLPFDTFVTKVEGLSRTDAARGIARIAQRAVEHLRDRKVFDLAAFSLADDKAEPAPEESLAGLFEYLHERFDPEAVETPISFYFSLGQDNAAKWSLVIDAKTCRAQRGKPEGGVADCVLKTSPEIFRRIVKEAYVPSPDQFISGAIKSNNIPLLQDFVRIFNLQ